MSRRLHLIVLLAASLALRLLVWHILPYKGYISDEAEYLAAATWLANGRGFAFFDSWIWTRPPLYVAYLAAHVAVWGPAVLWPIRLTQALLGTAVVYLVVQLAEQAPIPGDDARRSRIGLLAGWMAALCYSLISYPFFLLSETLFLTLMLAGVLQLMRWHAGGGRRRLVLAGALLGMAALSRGLLVFWLPFAGLAIWLAAGRSKRSFGAALIVGVTATLVILPWTIYATTRYGGLVLVDTTGGYNFMLGAQAAHLEAQGKPQQRNEKQIYNELIKITPHTARQRHAYETGLQWVAENPGGFVRKSGRELLDLLLISYGGAERLRSGHTAGQVPLPHVLGLLLDDTLYLLALPLALIGLARRSNSFLRWATLSWLLFNVLTAPLFFAINRFRVPLMPFLFIYAALALAQWGYAWDTLKRRRLGWGLAALAFLVVLPSYSYWPFSDTRRGTLQETLLALRGLERKAACDQVQQALQSGELDQALRLHDTFDEENDLTCLALLRVQIFDRSNQPEQALALLQVMEKIPERFLLEGEIYRHMGKLTCAPGREDCARNPFVAWQLESQNPVGWAWENLSPPITTTIDLGSGLDWGYIDGFYNREPSRISEDPFGEGSYRWMGPEGRLRFPGAGTGQAQTLELRVNGFRPPGPGNTPARLEITHHDRIVWTGEVGSEWQTIRVELEPVAKGDDIIVTLRSTVAVPEPADLASRQDAREQLRLLGVQLDWARVAPAAQPVKP